VSNPNLLISTTVERMEQERYRGTVPRGSTVPAEQERFSLAKYYKLDTGTNFLIKNY